MQVISLEDNQKEAWDRFVKDQGGSFLQSWEWGDFQERLGRTVFRSAVMDGDTVLAQVLYIKMVIPFGFNWYYIPHVTATHKHALLKLLSEIKKQACADSALLVHIDPHAFIGTPDEKIFREVFYNLNFRKRHNHSVQPVTTVVMDLHNELDQILQDMHKKTRYNIRLSQKKGVEILWSKEKKYIQEFVRLTQQTAARQNITSHSYEYYEKLLQQNSFYLVNALHDEEVIASHIVSIFGKQAVYVHGASSYEHRTLMAPYLLQWESVQKAKELGALWYDLWGIKGVGKNTKAWEGITRFKKGFVRDGVEKEYLGLYMYVCRPIMFYLYSALRKVRHIFSGREID